MPPIQKLSKPIALVLSIQKTSKFTKQITSTFDVKLSKFWIITNQLILFEITKKFAKICPDKAENFYSLLKKLFWLISLTKNLF